MCGISMIFHCDGKPVTQDEIQKMNKAIMHRGPDGNGFFIEENVALGHTRLSIVDIKLGHQPMHSLSKRHVITYNGEIYNFSNIRQQLRRQGVALKTHCDTEVINELYVLEKQACLKKLRGMFAFAIFDRKSKTLFAARDRLGIKPFYYFFDGKTFIAASEIKAIFASGLVEPQLNKSSIRQHFKYQFSISPSTTFENIYELPPGHCLSIGSDKKLHIKQYWDLEFPEDNEYETDDVEFWKREFEEALHCAADTHLIGEVPIGSYLSGGLDSSVTTYLLKEHYAKQLQSFSIHFTNPNSDESYAYRPVAEHLGIANSELTIDDDREGGYFGLLKECIYHLEQPQRMAVDIPHYLLSGYVKQQDYKVVYTGDGADEILAGYDCFRQNNIRLWGNEQGSEEAREAFYLSDFSQYFAQDFLSLLLNNHQPTNQSNTISQFGFYPAWFDFWEILSDSTDSIFAEKHNAKDDESMDQLISRIKPKIENRHHINQSLYFESKTRLPDWILWKSDRLSMAHGVEARVPFLDHPLAELAARIPPDLKLNGMDEKYLLKTIVSPHLPSIPGEYKKRGFYTPIREWFFREKHLAELNHYLCKNKLEETGIFNPHTVSSMIDKLVYGRSPTSMDDYFSTMKLEWSLMLVLTTQLLNELFIAKDAPCFHDI